MTDPGCRGRRRCRVDVVAASCRSCDGDAANTACTVSLNWRMLRNPAAKAIAVNGIDDVSMSTRAVVARCALAMASGPAPSSSVITRLR